MATCFAGPMILHMSNNYYWTHAKNKFASFIMGIMRGTKGFDFLSVTTIPSCFKLFIDMQFKGLCLIWPVINSAQPSPLLQGVCTGLSVNPLTLMPELCTCLCSFYKYCQTWAPVSRSQLFWLLEMKHPVQLISVHAIVLAMRLSWKWRHCCLVSVDRRSLARTKCTQQRVAVNVLGR